MPQPPVSKADSLSDLRRFLAHVAKLGHDAVTHAQLLNAMDFMEIGFKPEAVARGLFLPAV